MDNIPLKIIKRIRICQKDRCNNFENEQLHDNIAHKIKIDVLFLITFMTPNVFSDWLADMDHFFEWYVMLEVRRIRFTKISIRRLLERECQEPIEIWIEMKE